MTCVKTYWPAYIGAPAIQTSRRGRKTSEKIQVDNARKRHFTEKYQLVMLSSRNNVGTPVIRDELQSTPQGGYAGGVIARRCALHRSQLLLGQPGRCEEAR